MPGSCLLVNCIHWWLANENYNCTYVSIQPCRQGHPTWCVYINFVSKNSCHHGRNPSRLISDGVSSQREFVFDKLAARSALKWRSNSGYRFFFIFVSNSNSSERQCRRSSKVTAEGRVTNVTKLVEAFIATEVTVWRLRPPKTCVPKYAWSSVPGWDASGVQISGPLYFNFRSQG